MQTLIGTAATAAVAAGGYTIFNDTIFNYAALCYGTMPVTREVLIVESHCGFFCVLLWCGYLCVKRVIPSLFLPVLYLFLHGRSEQLNTLEVYHSLAFLSILLLPSFAAFLTNTHTAAEEKEKDGHSYGNDGPHGHCKQRKRIHKCINKRIYNM